VPASRADHVLPVIVAVDDELTAGIIEASLKDAGYPVLRALHGLHAVKIVNKNRARVIVVDLNTSRRRGLEIIRSLQTHASRSWMNVLALTVEGRGAAEDEARGAGADDFLMRPFNPLELVRRVDRLYSRVPSP
jgi:DNA-binding response OmpR family regulator